MIKYIDCDGSSSELYKCYIKMLNIDTDMLCFMGDDIPISFWEIKDRINRLHTINSNLEQGRSQFVKKYGLVKTVQYVQKPTLDKGGDYRYVIRIGYEQN